MNKYTESDVNRTHKAMVEQLIDICLDNFRSASDPLHSRVWYSVAANLESVREADYSMYDMDRILATANINAQEQAQ